MAWWPASCRSASGCQVQASRLIVPRQRGRQPLGFLRLRRVDRFQGLPGRLVQPRPFHRIQAAIGAALDQCVAEAVMRQALSRRRQPLQADRLDQPVLCASVSRSSAG